MRRSIREAKTKAARCLLVVMGILVIAALVETALAHGTGLPPHSLDIKRAMPVPNEEVEPAKATRVP